MLGQQVEQLLCPVIARCNLCQQDPYDDELCINSLIWCEIGFESPRN